MATSCSACSEELTGTYVSAGGKFFQVECFKCASCETLLGGKKFVEKAGFFYCEDDYFKLFGKMCGTCHEIIRGECINAMNQSFHPECFICTICSQQLKGLKFYRKDDKAYCEEHFLKLATDCCSGCSEPILDNVYTARDKFWHKECFKCERCNREIGAAQFAPYGDITYHLECFEETFTVTCAICNQPCENDYLDVEGKSIHEACFKCFDCGAPLVDSEWFQVDDKYYCQKDFEAKYQPKCVACEKVIVGDYIDVKAKNFHEECFSCYNCETLLNDQAEFDLYKGQIHCQKCIDTFTTQESEAAVTAKQPTPDGKEEIALTSYKYTFHEGEDTNTGITQKETQNTVISEEKEEEQGSPRIRYYTYEQLTSKPYPEDVDAENREMYLSDKDFVQLMGMSKDEFRKQPIWKQLQKKRNLRLY